MLSVTDDMEERTSQPGTLCWIAEVAEENDKMGLRPQKEKRKHSSAWQRASSH
jgi:hypothetical protein